MYVCVVCVRVCVCVLVLRLACFEPDASVCFPRSGIQVTWRIRACDFLNQRATWAPGTCSRDFLLLLSLGWKQYARHILCEPLGMRFTLKAPCAASTLPLLRRLDAKHDRIQRSRPSPPHTAQKLLRSPCCLPRGARRTGRLRATNFISFGRSAPKPTSCQQLLVSLSLHAFHHIVGCVAVCGYIGGLGAHILMDYGWETERREEWIRHRRTARICNTG